MNKVIGYISPIQKAVFSTIIAKVSNGTGKIRYAVLEELCETYDEMITFYKMIDDAGLDIVGGFPPRVKKAFAEYGIRIK